MLFQHRRSGMNGVRGGIRTHSAQWRRVYNPPRLSHSDARTSPSSGNWWQAPVTLRASGVMSPRSGLPGLRSKSNGRGGRSHTCFSALPRRCSPLFDLTAFFGIPLKSAIDEARMVEATGLAPATRRLQRGIAPLAHALPFRSRSSPIPDFRG